MTKQKGKLFLLPSPISEEGLSSISPEVTGIIHSIDEFIVEKLRAARRYVSLTKHPRSIEELNFQEIPDNYLTSDDAEKLLLPLMNGKDIGLMSEAGMPALADPGALFINAAHRLGIQVIPLAGPSSIIMALVGSGLEGQRFAFHGYLSAKKSELPGQLRELEKRADKDDATQIFIETPYRNNQVMEVAAANLNSQRQFCIAAGLGSEKGFVMTKSMVEWKKSGWPEIHKVPAVFLIR